MAVAAVANSSESSIAAGEATSDEIATQVTGQETQEL